MILEFISISKKSKENSLLFFIRYVPGPFDGTYWSSKAEQTGQAKFFSDFNARSRKDDLILRRCPGAKVKFDVQSLFFQMFEILLRFLHF